MCLGYKVLLNKYGNHGFMYDFLQKEGHEKESSQSATAILFKTILFSLFLDKMEI